MKKAIAIINPVLVYTKYLLLGASIFLVLILIAQFLKFDISLKGGLAQTMIPFLGTASLSMYLTKKTRVGKK